MKTLLAGERPVRGKWDVLLKTTEGSHARRPAPPRPVPAAGSRSILGRPDPLCPASVRVSSSTSTSRSSAGSPMAAAITSAAGQLHAPREAWLRLRPPGDRRHEPGRLRRRLRRRAWADLCCLPARRGRIGGQVVATEDAAGRPMEPVERVSGEYCERVVVAVPRPEDEISIHLPPA